MVSSQRGSVNHRIVQFHEIMSNVATLKLLVSLVIFPKSERRMQRFPFTRTRPKDGTSRAKNQ
jgi:hypothetical protein